MRILMTTLGFSLVLASSGAFAQGEGRYRMERTESGFVRLDTVTGEVSLCRETEGQFVCRMAADERAAFEKELDLLTARVEALEKSGNSGLTDLKPRLPTDEEIDRTIGIMERMMQRFMGIVKNLEKDGDENGPATDQVPQKT